MYALRPHRPTSMTAQPASSQLDYFSVFSPILPCCLLLAAELTKMSLTFCTCRSKRNELNCFFAKVPGNRAKFYICGSMALAAISRTEHPWRVTSLICRWKIRSQCTAIPRTARGTIMLASINLAWIRISGCWCPVTRPTAARPLGSRVTGIWLRSGRLRCFLSRRRRLLVITPDPWIALTLEDILIGILATDATTRLKTTEPKMRKPRPEVLALMHASKRQSGNPTISNIKLSTETEKLLLRRPRSLFSVVIRCVNNLVPVTYLFFCSSAQSKVSCRSSLITNFGGDVMH